MQINLTALDFTQKKNISLRVKTIQGFVELLIYFQNINHLILFH